MAARQVIAEVGSSEPKMVKVNSHNLSGYKAS
jgi:hypothetical protein